MFYKEKLEKSIDVIKVLKPSVIFLTGKSCCGKSFLSNKLNVDYKVLELDKIVRRLGKKYKIGKSPDYDAAFAIYKNNISNKDFKNSFVKEIRTFIKNNKMVIIDGAIANKELLNEIFKDINYSFIYMKAENVDKHYKRIYQRYLTDIKNNTRTLSFWDILDKSKNIKKDLKIIAKEEVQKSGERCKYFLDSGFDMFIVAV